MRGIVKEAIRIEIQPAETDLDACLTETMLIQKYRPRWSIVGGYSFLYPLIGIRLLAAISFALSTFESIDYRPVILGMSPFVFQSGYLTHGRHRG